MNLNTISLRALVVGKAKILTRSLVPMLGKDFELGHSPNLDLMLGWLFASHQARTPRASLFFWFFSPSLKQLIGPAFHSSH